jgi:hypothetical protein
MERSAQQAAERRKRGSRKPQLSRAARAYLLSIVGDQDAEKQKRFVSGCERIAEAASYNYWQFDRTSLPVHDLLATIEDFAKSVKEFVEKFDGLPQGVTVTLDLAAQQWLKETGGGDSSAFIRRLQSDLYTLESIAVIAAKRMKKEEIGGRSKPVKISINLAAAHLRDLFDRHGLQFSVAPTGRAAKSLQHILDAALPAVPNNLSHYLRKVQ